VGGPLGGGKNRLKAVSLEVPVMTKNSEWLVVTNRRW